MRESATRSCSAGVPLRALNTGEIGIEPPHGIRVILRVGTIGLTAGLTGVLAGASATGARVS